MKLFKLSFLVMISATLFMSCQKEYSVESNHDPIPAGTWQFNDSTKLFTGNIDTAFIETSGNTKILHLLGPSTSTTGQFFNLQISADSILKTGTYKASAAAVDFVYSTTSTDIYHGYQAGGEFIVNITVLANNIVTGTFSGIVEDSLLNKKTLTLGQFTSKVDLSSNVVGGGSGVSAGTLGSSSGNCQPTTFSGTYTQGVALTSSNTAQVTVTVATLGSYTISTNTVNGVTFTKSGNFTSTGTQLVTLDGTGTPTNSGAQNYTVTYGTSTCAFAITFGAAGPPAVGTLGGGPGACTPVTPAGTYTQSSALTAANTITIQANVTTLGSYNITTNTVNGVTFSGTGNFTVLGLQNVVLTGTGTPTNSGVQNFTVTFGSSTCNFSITFAAAPTTDYFPLTLNSNWTYGTGSTPTDSVFDKVIAYTPTISSQQYSTITENFYPVTPSPDDSLYYRKPGGDYYHYLDLKQELGLDNSTGSAEYIFLKDNIAQGTVWQSPNYSNTSMGVPVLVFIKMTLKAKAVPVSLGSLSFPDVIKVTYEYFVNGASAFTEERWFARGTGLIFDTDNSTFTQTLARSQIF